MLEGTYGNSHEMKGIYKVIRTLKMFSVEQRAIITDSDAFGGDNRGHDIGSIGLHVAQWEST